MGESRSRLHRATTRLFSQGGLWIPPSPSPPKPTPVSSCLCRALFHLLSCSLPSPHPSSSPHPLWLLPPPPICRVTACRRCVRVSGTGAVWSECVVSSSEERLLTGWMRESNTVYFNLFRMLELRSGFLLSSTALLAASVSHSCSAGWAAPASQTGTFLSICLVNPLWLRNVNGTAECWLFPFTVSGYMALKKFLLRGS